MKRAVCMAEGDMVATALDDLAPGDRVSIQLSGSGEIMVLTAKQKIPFGNKIALTDIPAGVSVIKYGASIGQSTREIPRETLVHVHNVRSLKVEIPPAFKKEIMRQMGYQEGVDY